MDFTETAADTAVHVSYFRFTGFVCSNNFLGTESYTETTAFAPGVKKGNIIEFFLFSGSTVTVSFGLSRPVYVRIVISHFCHAV